MNNSNDLKQVITNRAAYKRIWLLLCMTGFLFHTHAVDIRSGSPYYGAVVIDADSGTILKEDHAAAQGYPASMVKLANLFVILDDVKAGKLQLDEPVTISREAEKIGGRQVWLKTGETFPLEELIYAMMVHSANDAATALAIRTSGSKEAHAARMTAKARELGLHNTVFHSVHGLPPGPGQDVDLSSALDMSRLAAALIQAHPEALKYTSVATRPFRDSNPVLLTSSNKLLGKVPGCDGLKTGYFQAAGFSITATAARNGRRVIAVMLGCKDRQIRDSEASKWIEEGFVKLPPSPENTPQDLPVTVAADEPLPEINPSIEEKTAQQSSDWLMPVLIGLPVVLGAVIAVLTLLRRSR